MDHNPHMEHQVSRPPGTLLIAYCKGPKEVTDLEPKAVSFEQLAQVMAKPEIGEKGGSYILRGGNMLVPKRGGDNLIDGDLLVIDGDSSFDPETGETPTGIDEDEPDPEKRLKDSCVPITEAAAVLDRLSYRYIIHTTHTHTPGVLNKWRAYIPARTKNKEELTAVANFVIDQMHAAGCFVELVDEMTVFQQPWYLPRVKAKYRDSFICRASLVGKDVDVPAAVEWYAARQKGEAVVRTALDAPRATDAPRGDGPIDIFNRSADIGLVRQMLAQAGYKFAGKKGDTFRFTAPGSKSGTPGVTAFRGSKRGDWCLYSHHGGHDPLSHRLTDAFGALTRLRHNGDEAAALEEAKQVIGWKPGRDATADFDSVKINAEDFKEVPKVKAAEAPKPKVAPFKLMAFSSFVASLQPPNYLVDNIIQRGWLYSLTAMTGAGKTAVALDLAVRVASGKPLGALETAQGRVVYLSGENPEDVKARCLMLSQHHGVTDPEIYFLEGAIKLEENIDALIEQINSIGGAAFVIVDTSASYFGGEDDNSNVELGEYARLFRRICKMPCHPTVLVLAHPIKNPSKTNLLPRGGGAFLNEVDGNLTLWTDDKELTTLHWQGKFRGPEFEPMQFRLKLTKHPDFRDAKGREMPSVIALPVDFTQAEKIEEENYNQEDRVLLSFDTHPALSVRERAKMLGFLNETGTPAKSKVDRIIAKLVADKALEQTRKKKHRLTDKGKREIDQITGHAWEGEKAESPQPAKPKMNPKKEAE